MLTAHKIPRACQSCRLQLLSIFEHGFTKPTTRISGPSRLRPRISLARQTRAFSSSRVRYNDSAKEHVTEKPDTGGKAPTAAEIESVAQQARQTFGETLPKDYLTAEEYVVYERLYGRPLRETTAEDLEYVPNGENDMVGGGKMVRTGEFEEVRGEYAEGQGFYEAMDREDGLEEGTEEGEAPPEFGEEELERIREFLERRAQMEGGLEGVGLEEIREFLRMEAMLEAEEGDTEYVEGSEEQEVTEESAETLAEEVVEPGERGEAANLDELGLEQLDEVEGSSEAEAETEAPSENPIFIQAKNQREINAIAKLQQGMDAVIAARAQAEAARSLALEEAEKAEEEGVSGEVYDEKADWEDDIDQDVLDAQDLAWGNSPNMRTHPKTLAGRAGSNPRTLNLPKDAMVDPTASLLARADWKHLTTAAEKAFGGKGLPYSTSIPRSKKLLPQKNVGLDAMQHRMSEIEADSYISVVMPGTYASTMGTLVEVRKRLGKDWVRDLIFRQGSTSGARILDANGGGSSALAWKELIKTEWDILKEDGLVYGDSPPTGSTTVVVGPDTLRHRVSKLLDDTTFIPRLPERLQGAVSEELFGSVQGRKSYDIIIAPHSLFPLKEEYLRKQMVQNLWSLLDPNGGVLILIEKGLPRGFEAIAGARSLLMERHIKSPGDPDLEGELAEGADDVKYKNKEVGQIIAPCTNHKPCPMYPIPGLSYGRKDLCHFGQRYIRPPYLQRVLGASERNHEDVKYSYIAVRRGMDQRLELRNPLVQDKAATDRAFEGFEDDTIEPNDKEPDTDFNPMALPRAILPPLKRHGHVTLDLCTAEGKLERWTVPKSFSKLAYHDARKSGWGDLWALGAKTRVDRKVRLGRETDEEGNVVGGKVKGIRDGKMGKGGKKVKQPKKNKVTMVVGDQGFEKFELDKNQQRALDQQPRKRTKGGRFYRPKRDINDDMDDDDD